MALYRLNITGVGRSKKSLRQLRWLRRWRW